jgi:hypothetical protein
MLLDFICIHLWILVNCVRSPFICDVIPYCSLNLSDTSLKEFPFWILYKNYVQKC